MQFMAPKEDEHELREWLKDHIVRFITEDGKRQSRVRDYFVRSNGGEQFRTSNENWNSTPVELKKFLFRTALEELRKASVVRVDMRKGLMNESPYLVVNNVLDIIAEVKTWPWR